MNSVLRFVGLLLTIPFDGFAGQTEDKTQEEGQTPTTLHLADQMLEPQLGQNITLPCEVPSNANIIAVNWTKTDLGSQNVIFYRDGQPDIDNQHQSFENRVQLDNEPRGGNLSLVLKNVSSSDYGIYECSYKESKGEDIITSKPICIVILKEPWWPELVFCEFGVKGVEGVEGVVGLVCVVGVVVCVFGFTFFQMRKSCKEKNSDLPVSYTAVKPQLLRRFPSMTSFRLGFNIFPEN